MSKDTNKTSIGEMAGRLLRGMTAQTAENTNEVQLDRSRIPAHIAVIMDGNGRWAKKRSLPRSAGHAAGVESLRAIIRECDALGVKALTIYVYTHDSYPRWQVNARIISTLYGKLRCRAPLATGGCVYKSMYRAWYYI